jgi:hypothetical protein
LFKPLDITTIAETSTGVCFVDATQNKKKKTPKKKKETEYREKLSSKAKKKKTPQKERVFDFNRY